MKRLFVVRNAKGENIGQCMYYADKMEAKKDRDHLNSGDKTIAWIGRGPDHIGPHGNTTRHSRVRRLRRGS
jgi:hypothetical protein